MPAGGYFKTQKRQQQNVYLPCEKVTKANVKMAK